MEFLLIVMFVLTLIQLVMVALIFVGLYKNGRFKSMFSYFLTPSNSKLELDWFGRQFLLLFSKHASEVWYECRAHLRLNLISTLVVLFGIRRVVRIDYMYEDDQRGYRELVWFNRCNFDALRHKALAAVPKYSEDGYYYYQMFIPGYNVVHDFMNGDIDNWRFR